MLDGKMRDLLDPVLVRIGAALARRGVSANAVTLAGFGLAAVASVAIALQWYWTGLAILLLSRLADGLDGAVARAVKASDFGGFLDIVLDFAFYGGVPLGFVLADPAANAIAGAVLIFSFYVNGTSFLAFAVMAEKRALESRARGRKSLFFTTGLAEATETIAVFAAMCIFPSAFAWLSYAFAAICLYTALSRIALARRSFE